MARARTATITICCCDAIFCKNGGTRPHVLLISTSARSTLKAHRIGSRKFKTGSLLLCALLLASATWNALLLCSPRPRIVS
eukprot:3557516-Rhodomonas_salina.7